MFRPSRRLAAAAALTATAVALTACSSGTADADADPTAGGNVTFAVTTPFGSLDPNITASAPDAQAMRQVYDSLVELDADGELHPWLAEAWKVSDDGLTYEFTVREDVTFHDGTPFDAEAVCYNFDRIVAPETQSLYAISLIGPYDSCEALDATTARIALSAPYTPFLANLSTPFLGMVSPTAAESFGVEGLGLNPVGTGPFVFDSYVTDSELVLTRNEDYDWAPPTAEHEGPAYLEQLTFQIIADATVRLGSVRNGDVQGIGDVPAQEVAGVEADETLNYYAPQQGGGVFSYYFNTERPLLQDVAVRRAIVSAMDFDSAIEATYFGAYERATAPLSPATIGFDESIEPIAYDPEAAADALTDAGWIPGADGIREKDGTRLSLSILESAPSYDSRLELVEFLRQNLEDVGVELYVDAEGAAAMETFENGDYDLATTSFVSVDPVILSTLYSSTSFFDFARVGTLDDILMQAEQAPSGPERDALYSEIQTTVIDEAYTVPVYVLDFRVATTAGLPGLNFDAAAYLKFYDAHLTE